MTGPERKQLILIPENLNISRGEAEGNIENFFDLLYSWNFEAGNSFNFVVTAVVGHHSVLPSDVIDFFAMLPARRFWRETVLLLNVML